MPDSKWILLIARMALVFDNFLFVRLLRVKIAQNRDNKVLFCIKYVEICKARAAKAHLLVTEANPEYA